MLIYNIHPPQPADRNLPRGHGENPFERSLWERVGFDALAWNEPDSPGVHAMGQALGWDTQDREAFEACFLATYAMLRRLRRRSEPNGRPTARVIPLKNA